MDDTLAFAEELEDVALQLSSLNPLQDAPDAIATVADSVLAEYERLILTSRMLELHGVQHTAEWIHGILTQFRPMLPEAILELLQTGQLYNWIELTAVALREPDDASHLAALSSELLLGEWLTPPSEELVTELLLGLRTVETTLQIETPEVTTPSFESTQDARTERLALAWADDIHPELLNAYLQETPRQITEVAQLIRNIASNNSTPAEKRQAARLAHTIKGASGVVGVSALAHFTHMLEAVLERNVQPFLTEGLDETLQATADCLESLFENLQTQHGLPSEYPFLLSDLEEWDRHIQHTPVPDVALDNDVLLPINDSPNDFIAPLEMEEGDADYLEQPKARLPTNTHLSVPLDTVQQLLNLTGELITSTSQIAEHVQRTVHSSGQLHKQDNHVRHMLDELHEAIDKQAASLGEHSTIISKQFDELEMDAYNVLHSTSGLLTESCADSREITRNLQQQLRQLTEQLYHQQRLQTQLSNMVLNTRLIPVQAIVGRLERTVRETCRQTNKQARIEITGQTLQVDTDILQHMTDALLHMLRNAIDHGIEFPEQRRQSGKPETGLIQLNFTQKGDRIHITLSDDGQGINVQKVKKRAIERGLIQSSQQLTQEATLQLILQAGFTTRTEVSEISGRGVGMDVVKASVDNLQGFMQLQSTEGSGTQFQIQIPLTLIAINALLVRAGDYLAAIPSIQLKQLVYIPANDNVLENQHWHIKHQGKKLDVIILAQLLGWQSNTPDLKQGHSLLLVESKQTQYAIYIDEALKPREIVIKSLSEWFNLTQGISGACILANGAIAPVLDIPRLLHNLENNILHANNSQILNTPAHSSITTILIVDDSLSNRKSLSLMVEQMGYRALTAVDGLDALQHLHDNAIKLVLTDLEMPRMNGLELTQAIRIWPEMRHIPILMITSRSTQKHRNMAEKAGIDEYLTKPVEQTILKTHIKKWLNLELAA